MFNYFDFSSSAWRRLKSDIDLGPAHRSLFWAIVYCWNKNFFQEFEASKIDLMEFSGIKSETTYLLLLNDLVKFQYINFHKGTGRFNKSIISIPTTNFDAVKDSTTTEIDVVKDTTTNSTTVDIGAVNNSTTPNTDVVKDSTTTEIGVVLYNDKDSSYTTVVNTTSSASSNSNIDLKEKNACEEISEEPKPKSKQKKGNGTTFLNSEIGSIEKLTNYIINESAYPHADPAFYFNGVRDWRDKITGLEPTRQNWKLVVNQFFRNDISRYGKVISVNNEKSNERRFDGQSTSRHFNGRNNPEKIRTELAEIDNNIDRFLAIRNRKGNR